MLQVLSELHLQVLFTVTLSTVVFVNVTSVVYPSKHGGSDSEVFWLQPDMAITASVQPESGWIQLSASSSVLYFQIRPRSFCARPAWVQSGWPGRFWPNTDPKASQYARIIRPGSGRTQLALYKFLAFRFGCTLPQTALVIFCRTSLDPIWFWLTVSGFG